MSTATGAGTATRAVTVTAASTGTITSSGPDVRTVWASISTEVAALGDAFPGVGVDFNADHALVDCAVLALNDVIREVNLQFYADDELIREYTWAVADAPLPPAGPPAGAPPVGGRMPEGARVRLTAARNPRHPAAYTDAWFRRLGWTSARPLRTPEGARRECYGAFGSGGYAVERLLLTNPRYDGPAVPAGGGDLTKRRQP